MKIKVRVKAKPPTIKLVKPSTKPKVSKLKTALDFLEKVPVPSIVERSSKPHINDVTAAFDAFRLRCNAIQIANLRNPGKWDANMLKAQKELIAELTSLGLSQHIDFTKDEK